MPDEKEKKQPIGALWEKETRQGATFFSGNIEWKGEKIKVTIFQNTFKKAGEKTPDWRVFEDTYERPEDGGQSKSYASRKPDPQPESRHERPHDVQPPEDSEDLPF